MNKLLLVSIFAVLVVGTAPAFGIELLAYFPDNNMMQTAIPIPNPFRNSYFTLEEFEREGQSHWYTFNGREGQIISIRTNVPDIENSRDFVPSFDLILSDGQKLIAPTQMTRFHEPLTNTDWIVRAELRVELPETGVYFIRSHDELHNYHLGDTGKFSLFVGEMDDLSFADWIQVPFWILLVNQFFENFVFVTIMLTLLFTIAVIAFVMINRSGKN